MSSRLGDDVYDWKVEQLGEWLRDEGLVDCEKIFAIKRIDGCKLLTLSEADIKNLHVPHESKKKLLRAVDRFKKRKKGKVERMFGGGQESQRVATRKPSSISHDDEPLSDDDGWGSEEWDSDSGEGEEESSDDGGDYLEPEEDFSRPAGSYKKEAPAAVQTGLVAQLRQGIAQSLQRNVPHPHHEEAYADEDIYDEPPTEEDLYEEPSDSSGGAVVVRPPPKPARVENVAEYLQMRGSEECQGTYEAPMEGQDFSRSHNQFIPTKVQHDNRIAQPDINANNMETYDVPEFSDEESNYEVAEPQQTEAPPPRPPKNVGKPGPSRPPKQQPSPSNSFQSQRPPPKEVFRKPNPNSYLPSDTATQNNFPPQRGHQPRPNNFTPRPNNLTPRLSAPLPSQGGLRNPGNSSSRPVLPFKQESPAHTGSSPERFTKPGIPPNQTSPVHSKFSSQPGHLPNKPVLPSKQGSPVHSQTSSTNPPSPNRHPSLKPKLSTQGSQFQGIPVQVTERPKPRPKPNSFPPKTAPPPTEENRPPLVPKARPRPSDPTTREPAPSPCSEPMRKISGPKPGPPDSPTRHQAPRKTSGPQSPNSFTNESVETSAASRRPPMHVPQPEPGTSPIAVSRGGMLAHRGSSPSLPSLPSQTNRRPGALPALPGHQLPPEPSPTEPAIPPRPPKQGGDRRGVPLPPPPTHSSSQSKEQSSGSSIESGSADEPVTPLSKRLSGGGHHRNLPPPPSAATKSPLDVMKEAPWYHGKADRKQSEKNLYAAKINGAFLVRDSTRNPADFSMSLLHNGKIAHLQIPMKDGKYVLGASGVQKFDTVMDLVAYHRQNEVDLVKGGKTKLSIHAQNISR